MPSITAASLAASLSLDGRVAKIDTRLSDGTLVSGMLVPALRSQCDAFSIERTGNKAALVARVNHEVARSFCEEANRMNVATLKQALPAEGGIVDSSDRLQDLRTKLFDIRCYEAFEAPTPLTPAAASPPATAPPAFVAPAALPPTTPSPTPASSSLLSFDPASLNPEGAPFLFAVPDPAVVVSSSHVIAIVGTHLPELWISAPDGSTAGTMYLSTIQVLLCGECVTNQTLPLGASVTLDTLNHMTSLISSNLLGLGLPTSGLDLYNACSAVVGELPLTQRTLKASHFLGREMSPNEAPLNILNLVTTKTWKGPLEQFLVLSSIVHLGSTATSRSPTGGIYAELGLMEAELFSQGGLLPTTFNHLASVPSAVLEITSPLFLQSSLPNYLQNLVLTPGNYLQMRDYSTGFSSADAGTAIALLSRSLASSPFPLVNQLLGDSSPARFNEHLTKCYRLLRSSSSQRPAFFPDKLDELELALSDFSSHLPPLTMGIAGVHDDSGTTAFLRTLSRLLASEQRYGGGSRRSFDATEESSEGGHSSGSAAARALGACLATVVDISEHGSLRLNLGRRYAGHHQRIPTVDADISDEEHRE